MTDEPLNEIIRLIKEAQGHGKCKFQAPIAYSGRKKYTLPGDLTAFYGVCNGCDLFQDSEFRIKIFGFDELKKSNKKILKTKAPDDKSNDWFCIAKYGPLDYISIDLGDTHKGCCYDSFHETHGLAGEMPIISLSFLEFFQRAVDSRGKDFYWLRRGFTSHGDAYD